MTTSAAIYPSAATTVSTSARVSGRSSVSLLDSLFDILSKSLMMAHAIPDSGRLSRKQLEKVRAIAETI